MNKTRINFWLDTLIFIAFLVTLVTGLTLWLGPQGNHNHQAAILLGFSRRSWLNLHAWAGLGMIMGVLIHLALHLSWVTCIARRFFEKKLAQSARLNFLLDHLQFAAFLMVSLSGLVNWLVLPGGGYRGGRNPLYHTTFLSLNRPDWTDVHLWSALLFIIIVIIHLALHWQWIMCVVRRYTRTAFCASNECAT